jgi:DNA-binding CsgD family transcriptional regulator
MPGLNQRQKDEVQQHRDVLEYYHDIYGEPQRPPHHTLRLLYGEHMAPEQPVNARGASPLDTIMIRLLSDGDTYDDIAEKFHVGTRSASRLIQKATDAFVDGDYNLRTRNIVAVRRSIESRHLTLGHVALDEGRLERLTLKELTVIHLSEQGYNTRHIARDTDTPHDTVKTTVQSVLSKLMAPTMVTVPPRIRQAGIFALEYNPHVPKDLMLRSGFIIKSA